MQRFLVNAVQQPARVAFVLAVIMLPLLASYVMGGGVKMWHRLNGLSCRAI
jgi:hypothetical protein